MKKALLITVVLLGLMPLTCISQEETTTKEIVSQEVMEKVYNEVKTPFKYGVVFQHPDATKKVDSPTI
ncbi:MAG: hypothetical protein KAH25_04950, partial [Bacteroidales bacterium]|nr:hypothetical protein [Bacteroidales bacterium]